MVVNNSYDNVCKVAMERSLPLDDVYMVLSLRYDRNSHDSSEQTS